MQNLIHLCTLSLGLALAQTAPAAPQTPPRPAAPAPVWLRFAAASPELASADVYFDGKKVLRALVYTQVTPYDEIPSSKHTIVVRRHSESVRALLGKTLNLTPGHYTLALLTAGTQLKLGVFALPEGTGAAGNARISFFNFAQDAGAVDLLEPDQQGALLKAGLGYDQGATRTLKATPLRLNVVPSGKTAPAQRVAPFTPLEGHAYSVFVLGHPLGRGFQALEVEDRLERGTLSAKP